MQKNNTNATNVEWLMAQKNAIVMMVVVSRGTWKKFTTGLATWQSIGRGTEWWLFSMFKLF